MVQFLLKDQHEYSEVLSFGVLLQGIHENPCIYAKGSVVLGRSGVASEHKKVKTRQAHIVGYSSITRYFRKVLASALACLCQLVTLK